MKRTYLRLRRFVRQLLSPPDHKEAQMRSNPIRDAIMNLIEDRPDVEGTTAAEVSDALQIDPPLTTVAYHLTVLATNGYLERDDAERFQPA